MILMHLFDQPWPWFRREAGRISKAVGIQRPVDRNLLVGKNVDFLAVGFCNELQQVEFADWIYGEVVKAPHIRVGNDEVPQYTRDLYGRQAGKECPAISLYLTGLTKEPVDKAMRARKFMTDY